MSDYSCPISGTSYEQLANQNGVFSKSLVDDLVTQYKASPDYAVISFENYIANAATISSDISPSKTTERKQSKDTLGAGKRSADIEIEIEESVSFGSKLEDVSSIFGLSDPKDKGASSLCDLRLDGGSLVVGDSPLAIGRRLKHSGASHSAGSRGKGKWKGRQRPGHYGLVGEEVDAKESEINQKEFVSKMLMVSDSFATNLGAIIRRINDEPNPEMQTAVCAKITTEFTHASAREFARQTADSFDFSNEKWEDKYYESCLQTAGKMGGVFGEYLCHYLEKVPSISVHPEDAFSAEAGSEDRKIAEKAAVIRLAKRGYRSIPKVIEKNANADVSELEHLQNSTKDFGYFPINGVRKIKATVEKKESTGFENDYDSEEDEAIFCQWQDVLANPSLQRLFPHIAKACQLDDESPEICHLLPTEYMYHEIQSCDSEGVSSKAIERLDSYKVTDLSRDIAKIACIDRFAPDRLKDTLKAAFVDSMKTKFHTPHTATSTKRILHSMTTRLVNSILMMDRVSNQKDLRNSLLDKMVDARFSIDAAMEKSSSPAFAKWLKPHAEEHEKKKEEELCNLLKRMTVSSKEKESKVSGKFQIKSYIDNEKLGKKKAQQVCFDIESDEDDHGDDDEVEEEEEEEYSDELDLGIKSV